MAGAGGIPFPLRALAGERRRKERRSDAGFQNTREKQLDAVRHAAQSIEDEGAPAAVMPALDGASLVLLGEATHGTHEFYALRARITRALIEQHGFAAVAIEGDWPDAYQVNRFVGEAGGVAGAEEALRGFRRFPT